MTNGNKDNREPKNKALRSFADLANALGLPRSKSTSTINQLANKRTVEPVKSPAPKKAAAEKVPTRTLTLKRGSVEPGVVRQSFSHGRSKAVVVEKVKRTSVEYRAASQLIDRARQAGAETLDFSSLFTLDRVPPLVGLAKLREISLKGTKVGDISALSEVAGLQRLNISGTQVANLSSLKNLVHLLSIDAGGTGVSDLEPLMRLERLQALFIGGTKVVTLTPLTALSTIQSLDISDTAVNDLSPLGSLQALTTLEARKTPVSNLTPIGGKSQLRHLNLEGTDVSDLTPLSDLKALRRLIISNTRVGDLSPIANLTGLAEAAKRAPDNDGIQFYGCPIADEKLLDFARLANPARTAETINYLQRQVLETEKRNEDNSAPPPEIIPTQVKTAITFTSATLGPLDILPDENGRSADPEQGHLYSRMRDQLSSVLDDIPSQERMQVTDEIQEFLDQPAAWDDIKFKKTLWLCGNTLRNTLARHDAVSADPEPHYAKLPPVTAEALRHPVETWNIVVLGDPTLRELDALRLGPRDLKPIADQLEAVKPILIAAAADRNVTTSNAATTIELSLAAAERPADNIHGRQAQLFVRDTSQNLVVQILRGSYRVAQDLQNPQSDEARNFVKEYKAGIYKKLGEWTVTGSVAAAAAASGAMYYYSTPFFEFVLTQGPWLKAYLAIAFDNPQLTQIVDWVTALHTRLFKSQKAAN